jgi:hypothetical protein
LGNVSYCDPKVAATTFRRILRYALCCDFAPSPFQSKAKKCQLNLLFPHLAFLNSLKPWEQLIFTNKLNVISMKRFILLLSTIFLLSSLYAQNNVGIGTNTPHASAQLEVSSTTRGLLSPRMTTAQRNAIASPAKGLLVYDMDLNSLFHYNGSAWVNLAGGGGGFSLPFSAAVNIGTPTFQIENAGSGDVLFLGASTGSAINAYNTGNNAAISVNAVNGFGVYAQSFNSIPIFALSNNANNTLAAIRANNTGGGAGIEATSTNKSAIKATSNNDNPTIDVSNSNFSGIGVLATVPNGVGIKGSSSGTGPTKVGVVGEATGNGGVGVYGNATSVNGYGVYGFNNAGVGLYGNSISGTGVRAVSSTGLALDVSGKLKISGGNTNPSNGAVLTSDAGGNAVWKPRRIAFRATVPANLIPHDTRRKVEFEGESFDYGANFLPYSGAVSANSSVFTAPFKGVYHFSSGLSLLLISGTYNFERGYLALVKNGDELANSDGVIGKTSTMSWVDMQASTTVELNAGDKVWVEVYQKNGDGSSRYFNGTQFFSGFLVFGE